MKRPSVIGLLAGALLVTVTGGCGGDDPGAAGGAGSAAPVVTLAELEAELAGDAPPVLLDVRTPGEHGEGHIEGAVLAPSYTLAGNLDRLAPYRNRRIVVYCEVGVRSAEAARLLLAHGFPDVADFRGGMREWRRAHEK